MAPSHSTLTTALEQTAAAIWKRSVPVSQTGPHGTATKIGNALFPGWPLRISHFVTLRPSKAPITVCESAWCRRLPPGKRFLLPQQPTGAVVSVRAGLDPSLEFLRHGKALKCSLCQRPERRPRLPGPETNISSPYHPVIPRRVALQQSPLLFHWTGLLSSCPGASQGRVGLKLNRSPRPRRVGAPLDAPKLKTNLLPLTTLITVCDEVRDEASGKGGAGGKLRHEGREPAGTPRRRTSGERQRNAAD